LKDSVPWYWQQGISPLVLRLHEHRRVRIGELGEMLFYIALFIVCVIIAVAFLYVFRALENVGEDVYQVSVQSIRTRYKDRPKERKLSTTVNNTKTPWGWNGAVKTDHAARTPPVVPNVKAPWGWQGNHQPIHAHGARKGVNGHFVNQTDNASRQAKIVSPTVGWPYREEKFDFAGKSYKVARRVAPKPTDLSKTDKPWGW